MNLRKSTAHGRGDVYMTKRRNANGTSTIVSPLHNLQEVEKWVEKYAKDLVWVKDPDRAVIYGTEE